VRKITFRVERSYHFDNDQARSDQIRTGNDGRPIDHGPNPIQNHASDLAPASASGERRHAPNRPT
jgi:hypothetical protein